MFDQVDDALMLAEKDRAFLRQLAEGMQATLERDSMSPSDRLRRISRTWVVFKTKLRNAMDPEDLLHYLIRGLRWIEYEPNQRHYGGEDLIRWGAEALYAHGLVDDAQLVCRLSDKFLARSQMMASAATALSEIEVATQVGFFRKRHKPRQVLVIPKAIRHAPSNCFGGLIDTATQYARLHASKEEGAPHPMEKVGQFLAHALKPIAEAWSQSQAAGNGAADHSGAIEPLLTKGRLRRPVRDILQALPAGKWSVIADKTGKDEKSLLRWSVPLQKAMAMQETDKGWEITEVGNRLLQGD